MTTPGFDQTRTQLVAARAQAATAHAQLAGARQALAAAQSTRDQFARHADTTNAADARQLADLEQAIAAARDQLASAQTQFTTATTAAASAVTVFAAFTDPRDNITRFDDSAPIALFPVRIETRFAGPRPTNTPVPDRPTPVLDTALARGPGRLLIRIYPDDCLIDTFEPALSATELTNTQRYWCNIWRAGGIDGDQRAAWADLVAAHGSGRAGYLVDTYQPTNPADAPTKASASDEILVIATQTPPTAADLAPLRTYWAAWWRAGDNLAAQTQARATLDAAVGSAQADTLISIYQPFNLTDTPTPPATLASIAVTVAILLFPPDPPTKQAAWSQAPQVTLFPDRFVAIGYTAGQPVAQALGAPVTLPLYVGPDPGADANTDPTTVIHPDANGDLFVPDPLKWMVDYDTALAEGMAIEMPLTAEQSRAGFDRLVVIGLQLSASSADGATALATLLEHHQNGRNGLELVPQGTPTHNTTGNQTGYSRLEDPDRSYDDRKNTPLFTPSTDPRARRDGDWLATALGIDPTILAGTSGAGGLDQSRARAMQLALWPATLGYWMDKLMAPVFGDDTVEATRTFFTSYVRGRGALPAIRIGGQPYGVLPTTAFSRIRWIDRTGPDAAPNPFLSRLHRILTAARGDWNTLSSTVSHVGAPGDAHQILLNVLGLHPSSVEYYSRYAESLSEMFNTTNLAGLGPGFFQALVALALDVAAQAKLTSLGYSGPTPDLFNHFFFQQANLLKTVIDDRPLSETDPVRIYTDDNLNYLQWLHKAATQSLDALTAEAGFSGGVTPQAVLYLYLRHALMLGYYDTSYRLHKTNGVLNATELAATKIEAPFVHVDTTTAASESRFGLLYKTEPAITGSPSLLIGDYITANVATLIEAQDFNDQLQALTVLADAPTAELDRLFAEHIDTCTYRYDAWLLGLVELQLDTMRRPTRNGHPTGGLFLGAYAWVEDLRPRPPLAPARRAPDVAAAFPGTAPIMADPTNGGYIHAPSLTHARTAAVLRSGYTANATANNPNTLSVNLSSDRVRVALSTLEGIRNGQSLGALLGYQFEQGLHDSYGLAEVDSFIFTLRKNFPLVADKMASTATGPGVVIESIEARNVIDGRKFADYVNTATQKTYPYGLSGMPAASAAQAAAIDAQTNAVLDTYDAIADIALAEGVHQAVQGNFNRIASTLQAYSTGHFPPEPDVVQTPPAGIGLTHRVGLHLQPGATAAAGATPAAVAEPAIDAWLAAKLPPLATIECTVTWTDPVSAAAQTVVVNLGDLNINAVDVLDLVQPDNLQAMTQLDDRVLQYVHTTAAPRPAATLQIAYMTAGTGVSVFDVSALIRQLRTLIRSARELRPTDITLNSDARPAQNDTLVADPTRINTVQATATTLSGDIATLLSTVTPLVNDPTTNRATILADVDTHIDTTIGLLTRAAALRIPSSGWGFLNAWRHESFTALIAAIHQLLDRWQTRLTDYDAAITAYNNLPANTSDTDRFAALQAAETKISTTMEPLPATPAALRADLDTKRAAFATRRDGFAAAAATTAATTYTALLNQVRPLLPITQFDTTGFDLTPFEDRAIVIEEDLAHVLSGLKATLDARTADAQTQLDTAATATTASARLDAVTAAAKALLGKDFTIVPQFTLPAAQADEWNNAKTAADSGALLDYLTTTLQIDRPVDEWLTGIARVRPMMRTFELACSLVDALTGPAAAPTLTPIQFPYEQGAPWVAMQFPTGYTLDSDRLCYTAHYSVAFDKTSPQCGLLIDEWTETIPLRHSYQGVDLSTHDTGITFNYQRPDNEPPQAILLVTPAASTGTWLWDDLLGAVNETLDLAKLRAVEPSQLDETPYAMLVPATIMATTTYLITIATDLNVANGVITELGSLHA
ncbi:hypothetical protein [Mycobacterium sp.]|uniref:hypothetical protein n=1 Tax=Mycobacterium sp. TaxID=1785 RepID=UPI002C027A22|nr:hypothetical protein [Mycobacterium sp.]HTY30751.1 hypothetical protein [Mycobacterium sp.]